MKMIFIGGPLHLTSLHVSGNHLQVPIMPPLPSVAYESDPSMGDAIPTALYSRADFRSSVMITGEKGECPLAVVFAELERTRATLEKVESVLKDGWQNQPSSELRARMFDTWRELEKP
jgi:hypothetical protein